MCQDIAIVKYWMCKISNKWLTGGRKLSVSTSTFPTMDWKLFSHSIINIFLTFPFTLGFVFLQIVLVPILSIISQNKIFYSMVYWLLHWFWSMQGKCSFFSLRNTKTKQNYPLNIYWSSLVKKYRKIVFYHIKLFSILFKSYSVKLICLG